ncbi:MAG: ccmC [Cytophagaceae bacterium]|jgi:heme exporter protein C|nr:ccmC [Cytophagaceae bacterium]
MSIHQTFFNNRSPLAWWKIASFLLLLFVVLKGFTSPVPRLPILNETIRNLYFHVPMWFGMTAFLLIAFVQAIVYLNSKTNKALQDFRSVEYTNMGMCFGVLGIITGMLWAKSTWGAYWTTDPKLNSAAIGMLIYSAYIVLRGSIQDEEQRARISAVFNIFAFPAFVSLVYILPRLTDSLHPGSGGNPGFSQYDRDREMNLIFYSSGLGFILLGVWITTLRIRLRVLKLKLGQRFTQSSAVIDSH